MRNILYTLIPLTCAFANPQNVEVKLNKPIISEKSISCSRGGVIKTDEVTIYAKNFEYIKDDGKSHTVKASGNLLVKYNRFFFIGDSITYDFDEKRGMIENATGTVNNLISGGKKVYLYEDKSLEIEDAFVTPSTTYPPVFEVVSPEITVTNKTKAYAKTVTAKVNNIPILWLPSWGMTLDPKYKTAPTIVYNFRQERGQVPVIFGRYKLYDDNNLQFFARIEYRFLQFDTKVKEQIQKQADAQAAALGEPASPVSVAWYEGLGGAFDADYATNDKKISFQTRNFVTYNIWYLDINPNKPNLRYRIQGLYKGLTNDDAVETLVQWDKLSDRFIRSDFPSQLFELHTLERNEAFIHYRTDPAYITVAAKPRLNPYRGFKQDLPKVQIAARPMEVINGSKIYFEQTWNGSYLAYLYARQLQGIIPDFKSGRFSTNLNLYRPFGFQSFNITPRVGFDGIIYTQNQTDDASYQGICTYGGDASLEFVGDFKSFDHYIKPFVKYNGLTRPTSNNNEHFNFSINDGYATYNQLVFGLENEFYLDRFPVDVPTFALNLNAMSFFGTSTLPDAVSKAGFEALWHFPRMECGANFGWNFEKGVYDFIEAFYGWTINDYIAFSIKYRDRGHFWWRKDNHKNFILDSFRTINELAQTPLTDARYCFVTKLQFQLAPLWTLQIENNSGRRPKVINDQGQVIRSQTPPYVQTRVNLSATVSNAYRIGVTYLATNTEQDNFYGFTFDLM